MLDNGSNNLCGDGSPRQVTQAFVCPSAGSSGPLTPNSWTAVNLPGSCEYTYTFETCAACASGCGGGPGPGPPGPNPPAPNPNAGGTTPTPTATDKAVHFYTSCMDEATIETLGAGPIDDLIAQTHWTPTNGLSQPFDATAAGEGSDRMKLSQAMSVLWQHNINPFVDAGVWADDKHSTQNMLFVGQSGLSLPDRSYYMEDDGNKKDATQDQNMLALQQYMVDLLVLYEKNGDTASVQQRALALVLFEQRLAEQMVSKTILRDPQLAYNVVNVQNDLDAHQTMHWTTFLNLICNTGGQQQCKVPTTVIASSVDYLQGMDTVLRSTESGIVLDYLKWNVLQSLSHHLSLPYQDIRFAFSKQVYGVKSQPARWKTCVSRTNSAVGFALGQLYVEETFGGDSRATALEMIGDIRKWVVWRWWW